MQLDGDVAIHGHTHQASVELHKDRLFLNPGTVSGATGGWSGRTDASFMELIVEKNMLKVILHLTDWRVIKRTELTYLKTEKKIERCS